MTRHVCSVITVVLILFASSVAFGQLHKPEFADKESGVEQIMYIESGKVLYNYRWTAVKTQSGGKILVTITGQGDNNVQGDQRIEWTEKSVMEVLDNGLRTISWDKKSTGAEQETWKTTYNWNTKKVDVFWENRATGKKKTKVVQIKGNALAGDSMLQALRGFPFEKPVGTTIKGKIIDSSGMIMGGEIIHRGEEKIKTAFGEIDTYKLELNPTGLIGIVAPTMYIWYTKSAPHICVRFDGRDNGLTNPRTKKLLLEYEPAGVIK